MIDVNTIIGEAVTTVDGTLIIPVSKVTFGFAAGGSEFNTNKLNKYSESAKLPFGGGSGGGVSISPMAFLVVKDGYTNLLTLNNTTPIDKLIELIPDLMNKVNCLINKTIDKKSSENSNPEEMPEIETTTLEDEAE